VVSGFVVVDKEAGWTSHDVVARCRTIFGQRRIGHAGTLDPDATGVLLVGMGTATRLLRFATGLGKSYVGEVVLGVGTSTLDASGEVVERCDMAGIGLEEARLAAVGLTGRIQQVPPMVSAVRIGGRRLHELARDGVEVERPARPVTVSRFDVEQSGEPGVLAVAVDCSSGTYVRVLAAELGRALGGTAHLRSLRRLAVGSFRVEEALPLAALLPGHVRPMAELVRDFPGVTVGDELAVAVCQGKVLERAELGVAGDGPWPVHDEAGGLLAMYEPYTTERVKPAVVVQAGASHQPR
jgi:tRNA pseudouridine55 synthase